MKTLSEKQSNLLFRGTMIAILVTAAIIAAYMVLTGQYHTHTTLGA